VRSAAFPTPQWKRATSRMGGDPAQLPRCIVFPLMEYGVELWMSLSLHGVFQFTKLHQALLIGHGGKDFEVIAAAHKHNRV